ncbi:DUF2381 family protein [Stigmatella hybrida]|uniref:DUF2381 family protein n=1 Tax=Stigmatella hybrida TaxID=394097 RepID=UPI001CDB0F24|nr:DUF2381 family protein [Stigmatella hybrida]
MSGPPRRVVWLWIHLVGAAALAQPSSESLLPVRRLTLAGSRDVPEVRLAPGRLTTLLFDAPLEVNALRQVGRTWGFERVEVAERALVLLPRPGKAVAARIPLTVRFADGQPEAGLPLVLVMGSGEAEARVEVARGLLPGSEERAEPQAAGEVPAAEGAAPRAEEGGLMGLISTGLLGEQGIRAIRVEPEDWAPPGMTVREARLYVATGRMALEVTLFLERGEPPWAPGEAIVDLGQSERAAPRAVARLLEGAVLRPGDTARLVVEWDAPTGQTIPGCWLSVPERGGKRRLRVNALPLQPRSPETSKGRRQP